MRQNINWYNWSEEEKKRLKHLTYQNVRCFKDTKNYRNIINNLERYVSIGYKFYVEEHDLML